MLIKSKYRSELDIFIEVCRTIKLAKTLLLLSCKAVSVKEQLMTNSETKSRKQRKSKQENELEGIYPQISGKYYLIQTSPLVI